MRRSAVLAWSLCAACVLILCAVVILAFAGGGADLGLASSIAGTLAFPVVGALIAARQPANRVGWLLLGIGVFMTLLRASVIYAHVALVTDPGSLPGGDWALWLSWLYAPPVTGLVVFLPLSFPTGRLLSARWRPVAWAGVGFMVFALLGNALNPAPLELAGAGSLPNPLVTSPSARPLSDVLIGLAALCMFPAIGGAIASVVVRFRRAAGVERLQLKWFTYAAVWTPVPFLLHDVSVSLSESLLTFTLPLVPVSVGIAILRHRLYDIDRIINRTVVYGLVSALLGLVYVLGVVVLGGLLDRAGGHSPIVVAASTLAVAALFQPLRRRVQGAVDRRFNRRRYDAARTVAAFSARLRDEIDLDTLAGELLEVVDVTMQPSRVSLWLR